MPKLIDITGLRFGRLLVLERVPIHGQRPYWKCHCDCGREHILLGDSLKFMQVQSCGRCPNERGAHLRKHGQSRTNTYRIWADMIKRCTNPSTDGFKYYGGRGITVSDHWRHSFPNFLADMGERPPHFTLDRIDPNGNYEPGNCRWATPLEQRHNRR